MSSTDSPTIESDDALRRLAYLAGLLLIVVPFLQAASQIWPLQLSNIQWRFGAANALSSVLILPFCGLAIVAAVARVNAHAMIKRTVGAVAVIMTLGLAASFVVFVLDALQLKSIVTTKAMPQYVGASMRVGVATVIFAGAFAVLSLVSLRAAPGSPTAPRKGGKKAEEGVGLIVGQGSPSAE